MVQQAILTSLIIGAGAGLVCAVPHPQWWGHKHSHFPKFSYSGFTVPTGGPSGYSLPTPSSSSVAGATGLSYPPSIFPTGTGFSYPAGPTGTGISGPIGPTGTSYSFPVGPTGSSSSFAVGPTGTGGSYLPNVGPTGGSVYPSYSASASGFPSGLIGTGSSPVATYSAGPTSLSYGAVDSSSGAAPASASSSAAAPASASSSSASASSVTASSGCTFTDADTAAASKGSCSSIVLSGITVPAGETLDMTDLNDGTTVSFEGTTTFEYDEWEGPLISFSGKSITITGASGHVIDGNGAKWWDGQGSNGGVTKPNFFYAHDLTDSVISGLNVKNTPVQGFSVDGASNLKIEDVTIDDSDGDSQGGHNTDCFDIGDSTGVYLSGITCKNQDDCMAINSGTDISFTGGTCSGSHGLSIGSVGGRDDNTVENIYIADSTVSDSENGVRIKCNSGDTGSVKNVTFAGITLSGITDYGIVIEQDYENGDPTGTPTGGISITEVTLSDITGSVSDGAQAYYILCAACSDWTVSGVDVTGGSTSDSCEGVPSGVSLC